MRLLVAITIGIVVAFASYQWIADTDRSARRKHEEAIVLASRDILRTYVTDEGLDISDPLNRVRHAGKVYLFPTSNGWEVSGHYRRRDEKRWHAFLMSVDADAALTNLSVQDSAAELVERATLDPKFSTSE
jgi:hypothetical protein